IAVTVIATGFNYKDVNLEMPERNNEPQKIRFNLGDRNQAADTVANVTTPEPVQHVDLTPKLMELSGGRPVEVVQENTFAPEPPIFFGIDKQQTLNAETTPADDNSFKVFFKEEKPVEKEEPPVVIGERVLSADEIEERRRFEAQKRALEERAEKLRNMSYKIKGGDSNDEIEHMPAYLRRNVNIDNNAGSSSSHMSSYRVGSDNERTQPGLQTINTFLDGKKPD
ncbi:MAG: hypothetical protein EBZ77_12830, partial [Chitinophagia bacterium]|nr:hypothetical protein [Chitinophagia bacterium]